MTRPCAPAWLRASCRFSGRCLAMRQLCRRTCLSYPGAAPNQRIEVDDFTLDPPRDRFGECLREKPHARGPRAHGCGHHVQTGGEYYRARRRRHYLSWETHTRCSCRIAPAAIPGAANLPAVFTVGGSDYDGLMDLVPAADHVTIKAPIAAQPLREQTCSRRWSMQSIKSKSRAYYKPYRMRAVGRFVHGGVSAGTKVDGLTGRQPAADLQWPALALKHPCEWHGSGDFSAGKSGRNRRGERNSPPLPAGNTGRRASLSRVATVRAARERRNGRR